MRPCLASDAFPAPTLFFDSRAPLSLLKVKHDQPVELRIAERRNEKWVRQPPPPQGPFAGSGNRLGSVSPFPEASSSGGGGAAMPGSFAASGSAAGTSAEQRQPEDIRFEVDKSQPTTQIQIRLRTGDRCALFLTSSPQLADTRLRSMVATFNHTHTVGDIRRYINACVPLPSAVPGAALTRAFALQLAPWRGQRLLRPADDFPDA